MRRLFRTIGIGLATAAAAAILAACGGGSSSDGSVVRVGYFPNITHATAIVGLARGTFQEALGPGVTIEQRVFNAGPQVGQAVLAGAVDISYIGPNPAVNTFVRSKGEAARIVAGAASGGAAFVVGKDSGINAPGDLSGKRIATPGFGNTQDIALRSYLQKHGLKAKEVGGSVQVIPMQNPDALTLFLKREIDGAWLPEPWPTRLVQEAQGRVFVDERDLWPGGRFATTVVVVRTGFLKQHPDVVERFLAGHVRSTQWIREHPAEAQALFNTELARISGKGLPEQVLGAAWKNLEFHTGLLDASILGPAEQAYALGYLGKGKLDLQGLIVREPLQKAEQAITSGQGAPR